MKKKRKTYYHNKSGLCQCLVLGYVNLAFENFTFLCNDGGLSKLNSSINEITPFKSNPEGY